MKKCIACGNKLKKSSEFCSKCGAQVLQEDTLQNDTSNLTEQTEQTVTVLKKGGFINFLKKHIFIILGAVVAIAAITTTLVLLIPKLTSVVTMGKPKRTNHVLYFKDKEMFFYNLKEEQAPIQVTSDFDRDNLIEKDQYGWWISSDETYLCKNGTLLFYPGQISSNGEDEVKNVSIYYRNVKEQESEPVKIDSDIREGSVNASGTIVIYVKGNERNLFQYFVETETREKIASGVDWFEYTEDHEKILYQNSEGDIYLLNSENKKEKIVSEASSVEYVNFDFSIIYYIKDNTLYKQTVGGEREKIAEGVSYVINVYDSGEIYYRKTEEITLTYMDLVEDDLKDSDASITMPEKPTAPKAYDYDTWDEYYDAWDIYDFAYENYKTQLEKYEDKLYRDSLREILYESTLTYDNDSLYFYNGSEEKKITDNYAYYDGWNYSEKSPIITYNVCDRSNLKTVKFSELIVKYENDEIENIDDFSYFDTLHEGDYTYIASKDNVTKVEVEKTAKVLINESGTGAYYIERPVEEKNYGELYHVDIIDGAIGKPKLYDSDVCYYNIYFIDDNRIAYYKNAKENDGDLYINKEEIDFDVWSFQYYEHCDTLVYYTDYNTEKEYGVLKIYKDGESTKISDDVYDHYITEDGTVLFLYDYSTEYYRGELDMWKDGEKTKIDDDVMAIID